MQHNVSLPAWSDAPELVKDGVLHVSIHVPAWGATTEFLAMRLPTMFQSTLPRGERLTTTQTIYLRYLFQSTLPRGERQLFGNAKLILFCVSIHAPAWGATLCSVSVVRVCSGFNPRSRVGSDAGIPQPLRSISLFQSTLPRGERHLRHAVERAGQKCFNPRSRVGSDLFYLYVAYAIFFVSIHAPAWGATQGEKLYLPGDLVSIHAPAWGATYASAIGRAAVRFQSTLPRGERP